MEVKIKVLNDGKIITANKGEKLLNALADNGYFISASCGGRGDCGKCKVKIVDGKVDGVTPDSSGVVLSCKAILNGDITVEIPQTNGGGFDEFDYEDLTTERDGYGIVIDIGTTTVVAVLVDLASGKCLKKVSGLNSQATFGADVISRIDACSNGKLDALNKLIVRQCSKFTRELLGEITAQEV
ncbi:MAG: 2Fe-2S iron-sulfur cluster binding domain-containing protein, partial [Clostridia bacterium]|nr:2Fe-2S iron-sulfur cluster binding domain-containing protein [Clostridia bacterium]